MWSIGKVIIAVFSMCCAYIDLKKHAVPVWVLWLGTGITILLMGMDKQIPLLLRVAGGAAGICFFCISRWTKGAFGAGDSWMITIYGIFLGIWDLILLLGIAFFVCAVVAVICMAGKKTVQKQAAQQGVLPFIPFLTIGYMGVLLG